jgi:regulator of RNase E activity RraA
MVSDEVVARLGRLYTSTLSNALEDVGEDGIILGLPAVGPGMRLAGRAMCVLQISGPAGTFPVSDFKVGTMIDAAAPGDVVVVANGGNCVSSWGGTASYAAKLKGIGGLVVDGGVRDREEMIALGFPVFARHLVPTTGRTRLRVVEIGGTVTVSGQKVATGDVIVADGTGIVCIPAGKAADVLGLAEALAADDAEAVRAIGQGMTFAGAMARFRKI